MAFTLRIFVAGLIALVPYQDGRLTLVVPNADAHEHLAVLLYERRNVDVRPPSQAVPDHQFPWDLMEDDRLDHFGLYPLHGESISLVGGDATGRVQFHPGRRPRWYHQIVGAVPRRAGARKDFSWVAPMERIFPPDLSRIARQHLSPRDSTYVRGLWEFRNVRARASTFSLVDDRREIKSHTFKPKPGSLSIYDTKQAWSDIMLVEVPIPSSEVRLVFRRFDADAADATPGITLSPHGGERFVDVVLGNFYVGRDSGNHFPLHCLLSERPRLCPEVPQPGYRKIRRELHEVDRDYLPRILQFIEDVDDAKYQATTGLSNRLICTGGVAFTPPDS